MRSMASQPLAAVSRCQEFDSPIDQSGRSSAISRLTTNTRAVSTALSAIGLIVSRITAKAGYYGVVLVWFLDSSSFDVITVNADRHRPLERVDGYHQRALATSRDPDSFYSIQGTAFNPHTLADLQKRIRRPRQLPLNKGANCLNLGVGDRRPFAARSDEAEYTVDAKHSETIDFGGSKFGKQVISEKRELNNLLAVAPLTHFAYHR